MLRHLSIKNYALIDSLEIDLQGGLSIITGETGAGKSILLGALGLILGQRAEMQVIKDAGEKCVIEGIFDTEGLNLDAFFQSNDVDFAPQIILRREIKVSGSSRAFINDTPVSLNQLKELGAMLLDIHSQHQNLLLSEGKYQLEVLDTFAGNEELLKKYIAQFKHWKNQLAKLHELEQKEKESKLRQDYLQFQFDELSNGNIKEGELQVIEEQLKTLENAEEIKHSLLEAKINVSDGEFNALSLLKLAKQQLSAVVKYNPESEDLFKRIESCIIEISDIHSEIESLEETIIYDPQKISELNQRVDFLNHLLQKHYLKSDSELLVLFQRIEEELMAIGTLETEIENLKKQALENESALEAIAKKIGEKRRNAAVNFQTEVELILQQLGMSQAKIQVEILPLTVLSSEGKEKVGFLFSANKGTSLNEISKVASGGEISRLMLAVKSILAKIRTLPAIIFDEIDTGVSGEVASKLGNVLKGLGQNMQVIVITHLPQIAGKGKQHYEVFKTLDGNKARTGIKLLNNEERVIELAKMLSGENPSQVALENAKELLIG
ncbi:MAG: DNA repair protein RecN [Bacteroidetes bacterium]|nr:DNA repair protein RecN [Bacteroidota bacterium]